MKAITIRLDDAQTEKLSKLKEELHNSEAGVVRFALDLLYKTIAEKQAVPAHFETELAGGAVV